MMPPGIATLPSGRWGRSVSHATSRNATVTRYRRWPVVRLPAGMATQIGRSSSAGPVVVHPGARWLAGAACADDGLAGVSAASAHVLRADGGPVPPGGGRSLPDIDVAIPSPARMYDYYLGGKDNFPADRVAAETALSVVPDGRAVARANRRFMVRAVRYLARQGINQFVDLGTGIPTSPNVHEVARGIIPDARVVYVDNDPVVTAHNRALLANNNSGIAAVHGDIRYPLDIATSDALRQAIDFSQPVAALFVAVLHFLTNGEDPYNSVCVFRDRMPAGSYLVVSHITSDGTDHAVMAAIRDAYSSASAPAVFRSRKDIRQLFAGFRLVSPGLVEVSAWRGNNRKPADLPALRFLGGVGRKP